MTNLLVSADQVFDYALTFFWEPNNDGQPPHTTPGDSGGLTSWGVTYGLWVSWQKSHRQPYSVAMFQAQTKDDFKPLYRLWFFNAARCDALGIIGIPVFDMAANAGPSEAVKILQKVVGVEQDGSVGPITLAAVAGVEQSVLLESYTLNRIAYYRSLNEPEFIHGWTNRANACQAYTAGLIAGSSDPTPSASPSPAPVASPVSVSTVTGTLSALNTSSSESSNQETPTADDLNQESLSGEFSGGLSNTNC